jgi:ABC-2 type transport system ATP-binding protein
VSAMIEAADLAMRFGTTEALRGITLSIERGELFALLGPDGAGKTTFFRIVAGLIRPTGGRVQVAGIRTFGLVPQRFSLYEDLTIDENLHLRARLYDVPTDVARARTADLLARVGLDRFRGRLAGALSGGMKQKLALVSALLTQPELLLLDEPTTGVDPVSRREFWILLNQLHHEGLTLMVSTPYMDEAEYASRVAFLDRGRLTASGTRDEIVGTFPRAIVEVRSDDRMRLRRALAQLSDVDDVSLFGTRLHVRGRTGDGAQLRRLVTSALGVGEHDVRIIAPSLEDVFVWHSEQDSRPPITTGSAT